MARHPSFTRAHDHSTTQYHVVIDNAIPRCLGCISQHAVVAEMGVVCQMHAFQQEVPIADNRAICCVSSPIDDHLLPDRVVIPDF